MIFNLYKTNTIRYFYEYLYFQYRDMTEVGIAEYFSMAEALGIIATLFVIMYFSRKQMQALSVDIETKILNDMDDRIHGRK